MTRQRKKPAVLWVVEWRETFDGAWRPLPGEAFLTREAARYGLNLLMHYGCIRDPRLARYVREEPKE